MRVLDGLNMHHSNVDRGYYFRADIVHHSFYVCVRWELGFGGSGYWIF